MIINERNDLRTVLWKLIDDGVGDEGSLLGSLREGTLIASVEVPAIVKHVAAIPASYWAELDEDDFDRGIDHRSGQYQRSEPFHVPLNLFVADQRRTLEAFGKAIVARNFDKVPEPVRDWLASEGVVSANGEGDWEQLTARLIDCSHRVGDMAGTEAVAFVARDDLIAFHDRVHPKERKHTSRGSTEAIWTRVWQELARRALSSPDAKSKSANAWAKELAAWLLSENYGNAALKADTLQREIKKLLDS